MDPDQAFDFHARPAPMTALDGPCLLSVDEALTTARRVIVLGQLCGPYGFDRTRRPRRGAHAAAGGVDRRRSREPGRTTTSGAHARQLSAVQRAHRGAAAGGRSAGSGPVGFGAAFESGMWVDHWIVEWRDGDRWVRSDCQIDDEQQAAFGIDHDPLDLPADAFLRGGEAWQRCRAGDADLECFGIHDVWGLWFVQGNAVADLAALNKVEMLPWDDWGIRGGPEDGTGPELVHDRVDEVAVVCQSDDLEAVRALYDTPDLRVPPRVQSWYVGGGRIDDVGELMRVAD